MKYGNLKQSDAKKEAGSASPKQREFLRKHCGFTQDGAKQVSAWVAHRLISQKKKSWGLRTSPWRSLRKR